MGLVRLIAVLLLLVWSAAAAFAQDDASAKPAAPAKVLSDLDPSLDAARLVIDAARLDAVELENLREKLLMLRGQAVGAGKAAADALETANARLQPLGPAPADGTSESAELKAHRAELTRLVSEAQLPVLRAQEAVNEINAMIGDLDRQVWSRVSVELSTLGPSPALPANWTRTATELGTQIHALEAAVWTAIADPSVQGSVARKLPRSLALLVTGLAITFVLRRRLSQWIAGQLGRARTPRGIAWLAALRNLTRLLLPAMGAGLLFAAIDPAMLHQSESIRLFSLPGFVVAIIGAGWLGDSLFSPALPQYRLVPVGDAEALRGSRLTHLMGGVLAAHLFIEQQLDVWNLTPAANATLTFPFTLLGGYALWRVAALLRVIRRSIAASEAGLPPEQHMSNLGHGVLTGIERMVWVAAIASPALAAIGFFAASQALLYSMTLTLALLGANVVLFDLIHKTGVSLSAARIDGPAQPNGGLGPVFSVAALILFSAPVLALIWGARRSDLVSFWIMMRDGGRLGGVSISAGAVASFILVFGLCYGITRAFQSVLVNSVLPRTRMDAGGKNAILSGVSYVGFTIGALMAISATGIDLSSIAIVAGALSVGIGFGLQNIVSNFVSGIILLIERPIKEGDWIEVGSFAGYVRRISVRSTEIETFDRASVILPNSDLIAGAVLNRTHKAMSGRLQVPVGVAYGTDTRLVDRILTEIAENHPLTLEEPAPRVLFMGFGDSSLNFEIRCVLRDVNFSLSAKSDMNFEIEQRFREEGISIPFPQREVRMVGQEARGAPPADRPE